MKKTVHSKKAAKKAAKKFGKKAAKKGAAKKQARKAIVRRRLEQVKINDPALPLSKFVERVNEIASRYLPNGECADGRVTEVFTKRTVRHYQNKGIIAAPEKEGKEARYRYLHVLQAVLTRLLLVDGIKAPAIQRKLANQPTEVYEQLLALGPGAAKKAAAKVMVSGEGATSFWTRIEVMPGIELSLASHISPPETPEDGQQIRREVNEALKEEFQRRRRQQNSA